MKRSLNKLVTGLTHFGEQIPDLPVSGIATHSDAIHAGDLYIAIEGTQFDGHDYIPQAIKNGAIAIITNGRDLGRLAVPQIKVANPRRAASWVAAEFYNHPSRDLYIIGITGTNGKTTTASLIRSILTKAQIKCAQLGTLGLIADGFPTVKTLTTSDPITLHKTLGELYQSGVTHVIMEISSHAIHQFRTVDVDINLAVFTNLTPEHLDYHGTMDEYYQTKAKLFKTLPITATAIVNVDDEVGLKIKADSTAPVVATSVSSPEDVHFAVIDSSVKGISGTIAAGEHEYRIESALIGNFNAENILSAVAAAHAMGISPAVIQSGIRNCEFIPGRMERFSVKTGGTVIVDYAHTPDAYEKVLSIIKQIAPENGSITAIFGAGGDRDPGKRPKLAAIAEIYTDRIFITPDNPRYEDIGAINAQIISGFTKGNYTIFDDRGKAVRTALSEIGQNDIVVIFGKGREEYQDIRGEKIHYSDLEIIKEFCHAD